MWGKDDWVSHVVCTWSEGDRLIGCQKLTLEERDGKSQPHLSSYAFASVEGQSPSCHPSWPAYHNVHSYILFSVAWRHSTNCFFWELILIVHPSFHPLIHFWDNLHSSFAVWILYAVMFSSFLNTGLATKTFYNASVTMLLMISYGCKYPGSHCLLLATAGMWGLLEFIKYWEFAEASLGVLCLDIYLQLLWVLI